jgi:peptide methionine sulfoxide reductase msrA/msrB
MNATILILIACTGLIGCGRTSDQVASAQPEFTKAPAMSTLSKSGFDLTPPTAAQHAALIERLDPATLEITQRAGTEPAFCGTLLDNKKEGTYACVVCGLPLFASDHKFTSGTGWPSFFQPIDARHIARIEDRSHGMVRTEIACGRCNAHLGHVFPDGPPPSGERHCMNSAALVFHEEGSPVPDTLQPVTTETAYFAGGCFWGIEHYFQQGAGVIDAESGYMQGHTGETSYADVCSGTSGHAESVKVIFDPRHISYRALVDAFFRMHNPTEVDRQGPDVGPQYRSGIWYTSPEQQLVAAEAIGELAASGRFSDPIATQLEAAADFHSAETYHQDYVARTGRGCHIADPWTNTQSIDSAH